MAVIVCHCSGKNNTKNGVPTVHNRISFTNMKKSSEIYRQRLETLRAELKREGLDGFIVPRADSHQGEEVPACAERLAWLTGFTGSAGIAVVLKGRAVVLTDGRYSIQVKKETDHTLFSRGDITKKDAGEWIAEYSSEGAEIGFDPWLHTPEQIESLREKLVPKGIILRDAEINPVDEIWQNRPPPPVGTVELYPLRYAGISSSEKIRCVAEKTRDSGACAAIITMPDSIAWMLNIRGSDLRYTPVALSFAIVHAESRRVDWFITPDRVPQEVHKALGKNVCITGPHSLWHEVTKLAGLAVEKQKPVMLDFKNSSIWFKNVLESGGASVISGRDPCILYKAVKNEAEQEAMACSHRRDGLALTRFLAWLEGEDKATGTLTEISVAEKLEEFRRQDSLYRGPSFATISAFGVNGAVVHYRASNEGAAKIKEGGLLLLDSGGQYEDGTTDVTRTVAIGKPSDDMRRHFTLVLKSHIALADAEFPEGTIGTQIDMLARRPLWQFDMDYAHGTGHGVGCFLAVHEGPAGLSPKCTEKLMPGMILSNEPGFYLEGYYGIRIENLVLAERTGRLNHLGVEMLRFRTLTLVPLDRNLINADMLNEREKHWLNSYHNQVRQTYRDVISKDEATWLKQATAPL
jgi:Xaa-Pro aminopeptidase